jgi:hypothetical protein
VHNLNVQQLKHHAAIGGVALNWTHLENQLQSVLWRLTGLSGGVGRCITQHMPFRSLCDAILTVTHETPAYTHLAPELEQLLRECDQLRIKRNDTVHALWGIFLGGPFKEIDGAKGEVTGAVIKARNRLNVRIYKTTASEIDDISEEILAFSKRLGDFAVKNLPSEKK